MQTAAFSRHHPPLQLLLAISGQSGARQAGEWAQFTAQFPTRYRRPKHGGEPTLRFYGNAVSTIWRVGWGGGRLHRACVMGVRGQGVGCSVPRMSCWGNFSLGRCLAPFEWLFLQLSLAPLPPGLSPPPGGRAGLLSPKHLGDATATPFTGAAGSICMWNINSSGPFPSR